MKWIIHHGKCFQTNEFLKVKRPSLDENFCVLIGMFSLPPNSNFHENSKLKGDSAKTKKNTRLNKKGGIFRFKRIPGLFWNRRVLHSNPWRLKKRCSQEGRCCGRCHHALWASPDTGHLRKFMYLPLENSDWRKVQYIPIWWIFHVYVSKYWRGFSCKLKNMTKKIPTPPRISVDQQYILLTLLAMAT